MWKVTCCTPKVAVGQVGKVFLAVDRSCTPGTGTLGCHLLAPDLLAGLRHPSCSPSTLQGAFWPANSHTRLETCTTNCIHRHGYRSRPIRSPSLLSLQKLLGLPWTPHMSTCKAQAQSWGCSFTSAQRSPMCAETALLHTGLEKGRLEKEQCQELSSPKPIQQ